MRTDRFLHLILMVVLIVLLYNLNTWSIPEGLEANYAEIAREMLRSGDYLHPRLLAVDTYEAPPLPFWLMSLGMHLWGVNAFGVRFFSQVALVAQAALLYPIAHRLLGNTRVALFSALIYLSLPLVLVSTRILSIDIFLTLFELGAIYSVLVYYLDRKPLALYGLATCLGLGFLCAGFRILLLPSLMGLCLLTLAKPRQGFHYGHGLFALLISLGIGGGWYLYIAAGPGEFSPYFWQAYVQGAFKASVRFAAEGWQLPLALLCGLLPWLIILGANLWGDLWQNKVIVQIFLFGLLVPIIFLTLISERYSSFLTIAPVIAMLLGYLINVLPSQSIKRYGLFFSQFYGVLGTLALVVPLSSQLLGATIRLTWPLALTAGGTLISAILLFRLIKVGLRFRLIILSLVASLMLTLYGGYFRVANPIWVETTDPVAQLIKARKLQDLPILVFNETLPSLAFNLDRTIITIDDGQVTPDVSLQTRRAWRNHWIRMNVFSSTQYLRRLIHSPSVLIVPGELSEDNNWLWEHYPNVEQVGRWQVRYRMR